MSDPIQALLNLDAADQDRIESLLIRVANGSASGAEHRQFERNMLRLSNMTTENQQGNEKDHSAPKLHPYADHPAATPPPDMPSRLLSMPKGNNVPDCSSLIRTLTNYRNSSRNISIPTSSYCVC